MQVPRPTAADKERFRTLVPTESNVEIKPMFGNLGAFVNGNMFMGLLGADIGVKLPEEHRTRLLAQPGAGPFGPEGRPMAAYVTLPAGWSARKARPWIAAAHAAAAALPPKAAKPAKGPKKGRAANGAQR